MSLSQRKGSSEMQMAQTPNTMDIERNLLDLAIRRSLVPGENSFRDYLLIQISLCALCSVSTKLCSATFLFVIKRTVVS